MAYQVFISRDMFLARRAHLCKSGGVIAATTAISAAEGRNDNLRELELFVDFYFA